MPPSNERYGNAETRSEPMKALPLDKYEATDSYSAIAAPEPPITLLPTSEEESSTPSSSPSSTTTPVPPTNKLRIAITLLSLGVGLLLSSLETSIVATALVSISSDLGSYSLSHWIVVSYLLTYTGFMLVYARLSDVFGRKAAVLAAVALFGLFSLGCGLAQDMTTLIAMRALQGAGASGIYSMAFAIGPSILPARWFGASSAAIGAVYASSSILGPLLGGVIAEGGSWRWIFLLNVPPSGLIFVAVLVAYPAEPLTSTAAENDSTRSILQLDVPGLLLSLGATVLLVFALECGGSTYPWLSPAVLSTLLTSLLAFALFLAWLLYLLPRLNSTVPSLSRTPIIPAFPLPFLRHRALAAAFLASFFAGAPFTATLILLPQRLQLAHSLSPLQAGVRMLPLLLSSALGSGLGGAFARLKHGAHGALIAGSALVLLGLGLEYSVCGDTSAAAIPAREYAYLAMLGLGFGTALSSLVVLARMEVGEDDGAVLMASLTQVRVLGGCVGLAAANAAVAGGVQGLAAVLGAGELRRVLSDARSVADLPGPVQLRVREVFAGAFASALVVVAAMAAVALLASLAAGSRDGRKLVDFRGPAGGRDRGGEAKKRKEGEGGQ